MKLPMLLIVTSLRQGAASKLELRSFFELFVHYCCCNGSTSMINMHLGNGMLPDGATKPLPKSCWHVVNNFIMWHNWNLTNPDWLYFFQKLSWQCPRTLLQLRKSRLLCPDVRLRGYPRSVLRWNRKVNRTGSEWYGAFNLQGLNKRVGIFLTTFSKGSVNTNYCILIEISSWKLQDS